jgi:hypothetical protein
MIGILRATSVAMLGALIFAHAADGPDVQTRTLLRAAVLG